MESQIVGVDCCVLPVRKTVGKIRRGRKASDTTAERIHRFRVIFRRERRACRPRYLSFGFGDGGKGAERRVKK